MDVQFDRTKTLNTLLYVANRVQRKDFHKIFKLFLHLPVFAIFQLPQILYSLDRGWELTMRSF